MRSSRFKTLKRWFIAFSLLGAISSKAGEDAQTFFSSRFCAQKLTELSESIRTELETNPRLKHYAPSELNRLAARKARAALTQEQIELILHDLEYFTQLEASAKLTFQLSERAVAHLPEPWREALALKDQNHLLRKEWRKRNSLLREYLPWKEDCNFDRVSLVRQSLSQASELLVIIEKFYSAHSELGDNSEIRGTRPLLTRKERQLAYAFAISDHESISELTKKEREEVSVWTETDRSVFKGLTEMGKNAYIAEPIRMLIEHYTAFLAANDLPPCSRGYEFYLALKNW